MLDNYIYPMSPPSESAISAARSQPDFAGSIASLDKRRLRTSTVRPPCALRREQSPPRNAKGEIICSLIECRDKQETFRRPCEWNKHMDRHERPYKCDEPDCEVTLGFTYSGGLLRHQREVHQMHLSTKPPLFCPFPNCNRSSGIGFTRKENLEEHKRRRHVDRITDNFPRSHTPSTITLEVADADTDADSTGQEWQQPAKRRRTAALENGNEGDEGEQEQKQQQQQERPHAEQSLSETDTDSAEVQMLKQVIQRQNEIIQQKDELIKRQALDLHRLNSFFQPDSAPVIHPRRNIDGI